MAEVAAPQILCPGSAAWPFREVDVEGARSARAPHRLRVPPPGSCFLGYMDQKTCDYCQGNGRVLRIRRTGSVVGVGVNFKDILHAPDEPGVSSRGDEPGHKRTRSSYPRTTMVAIRSCQNISGTGGYQSR